MGSPSHSPAHSPTRLEQLVEGKVAPFLPLVPLALIPPFPVSSSEGFRVRMGVSEGGKAVAPPPHGHPGGNQGPPQGAVLEWAAEPAGAKVLGPCTLGLTLRPGEPEVYSGQPGTQPDL